MTITTDPHGRAIRDGERLSGKPFVKQSSRPPNIGLRGPRHLEVSPGQQERIAVCRAHQLALASQHAE